MQGIPSKANTGATIKDVPASYRIWGSITIFKYAATGPYQYSLHHNILLFQVWFHAI